MSASNPSLAPDLDMLAAQVVSWRRYQVSIIEGAFQRGVSGEDESQLAHHGRRRVVGVVVGGGLYRVWVCSHAVGGELLNG